MRLIPTFILIIFTLTVYGQTVNEMTPTLGYMVDLSPQKEIEFIKNQEKCEAIWKKLNGQVDFNKLTNEEKAILEKCSETKESSWQIIGNECSWYCGGGQDTNSASSNLKPFKGLNYEAKNIHDLSYQTTWIEGVPGYGIGESVTYHFPPQNPRITEIIIVNGYVKSEQTWKDNSRVRKLKMYVDGKPFAILNLFDCRQEQHFKFEPLGYGDRQDLEQLQKKPWWTIKFEILDVYKGEKYDDTAITEIYFDGIDVH
ncbi:MAG: NADase-type glycan-binding domain-containing protein [Bacteroidales bacterium]